MRTSATSCLLREALRKSLREGRTQPPRIPYLGFLGIDRNRHLATVEMYRLVEQGEPVRPPTCLNRGSGRRSARWPLRSSRPLAVSAVGRPRRQRTDTATPARPAGATVAPTTPVAAHIPTPTQVAATPEATGVPDATAIVATATAQPLPRPTVPGVDLHDSQVVTSVGQMRPTMAPWRDMGANRLFSTHVFGTPLSSTRRARSCPGSPRP